MAKELSEDAHVPLRHLRLLSGDGEVLGEKGLLGDEDVGGARVLPAVCARSSANGAPVGSATLNLYNETSRCEVGGVAA